MTWQRKDFYTSSTIAITDEQALYDQRQARVALTQTSSTASDEQPADESEFAAWVRDMRNRSV